MLYSTRALVLSKREIKDREFTYTFLTQNYGRVGGFARETKSKIGADIGALVEVLFDTKGSVNKIRSLEPIMSVHTDLLGYGPIHEFLLFIECLRKHFPEGSGDWFFGEIFLFFTRLSESLQNEYAEKFEHWLFLLKLRLIGHSQSMDNEVSVQYPLIAKLARLAESHTLEELLRIKGIPSPLRSDVHTLFLRYFFE